MRVIVPDNLSETTVHQYMKLSKIQEDNPDAVEFQLLKMVQIFCNLKQRELVNIPVFEMEKIAEILKGMLEATPEFKQRFMLNGVEYGFIPNLNKMSYAEYMDLSNYLNDNQSLDRFMAVCYRPVTESIKDMYKIEDYDGSDKLYLEMRNAPLDVAIAAKVFFWNLAEELMQSIQNYLTKEEMMRMQDTLLQRKDLMIDGAGIKLSTY